MQEVLMLIGLVIVLLFVMYICIPPVMRTMDRIDRTMKNHIVCPRCGKHIYGNEINFNPEDADHEET